jgi:hypothetical protein
MLKDPVSSSGSEYNEEAQRLLAQIPDDLLSAPPTPQEIAETEEGWQRLQRKIAARRVLERAERDPD